MSDYSMKRSILTNREKEVFELLVLNKTTKEVADLLRISEKTVHGQKSKRWQTSLCFPKRNRRCHDIWRRNVRKMRIGGRNSCSVNG